MKRLLIEVLCILVQGAIYLDSDLEAVRRCYLAHFPLPDDPLTLLKVGCCIACYMLAVLQRTNGRYTCYWTSNACP